MGSNISIFNSFGADIAQALGNWQFLRMFFLLYKYDKKIANAAECAFTYYKQNNSDIERSVCRECFVELRVNFFSLIYSIYLVCQAIDVDA